MEFTEIEFEIAKNQIGIDFDALEKEEVEESAVLPKELIKPVNHDWINNEVLFCVATVNNDEVCPNISALNLCGKTMTEWVKMAGGQCNKVVIEDYEDILAKVRSIDTNKKIIALFYSDTPLLDRNAFYRIMDYFSSRSINFLQLSRGFIVKTEFLKNNPNLMSSGSGGFDDEALLVVDSAKKLEEVHSILNKKILRYHIANGVVILGKETVFIDADCEIDGGVVIYPNNIISGQSIISSGSVLESGNIIKNSIVGHDCVLAGSYIENSKIGDGIALTPSQKLINEEV